MMVVVRTVYLDVVGYTVCEQEYRSGNCRVGGKQVAKYLKEELRAGFRTVDDYWAWFAIQVNTDLVKMNGGEYRCEQFVMHRELTVGGNDTRGLMMMVVVH